MRILADTNVFIRFCRRLPLPANVERVLSREDTERCLSPVSVIELFRLWQKGVVPDNPDSSFMVGLCLAVLDNLAGDGGHCPAIGPLALEP